jgi:predicted RNA polymerase sigma factor
MPKAPLIALPRDWSRCVKSGYLHALGLARAISITARSGFDNSPLERARLIAKADHVAQENALLKEELRIKDARTARIDPAKRPHYPPVERLALLALRAATGWNTAETARRFFLAPATIAAWMRRLDQD